jgi:hypothetical protein
MKMNVKEIYELMKKDLSKYQKENGVKLSITKKDYKSITICLMSAKQEVANEKVSSVNHYYIDRDDRLTEYGQKVLQDIVDIAFKNHWDESDLQTDYHHSAFYFHLSVGKWDKPFEIK